jgi:aminoglycoside phosphotransferase family enzyme/predicted kinase
MPAVRSIEDLRDALADPADYAHDPDHVSLEQTHISIVDYAVKMQYLDPDRFLDAKIDRGEATAVDVDRVATTLCSFYRERPSTPEVAETGWINNLRVSTDENVEQTADQIGSALTRPAYEALRSYTDRFYDQNAALFRRRRAGGFIVNGHCDLRLEHVHLTDDRVCICDCIEFNERFRHLDVANDVAFLAMDLDFNGRTDLAKRLVGRVGEALGDPHLGELIDFYKCYRAYVRGKVERIRAAEDEVPPADRGRRRIRAHRYYQWALRYAVAGAEPLVIVVFGRSGTGKSTQAAALARALGWAHVSSDRVRKMRAGIPLHHRTDEALREHLYSTEMTERTYETLRTRAVERGHRHKGTVLDATYSAPDRREALRAALRAAEIPYAFVELTAPNAVLRNRLACRDADSATASDARAENFDFLSDRYQAPSALEDPRHVRVDAEGDPQDTTLAVLKALIRLNGQSDA